MSSFIATIPELLGKVLAQGSGFSVGGGMGRLFLMSCSLGPAFQDACLAGKRVESLRSGWASWNAFLELGSLNPIPQTVVYWSCHDDLLKQKNLMERVICRVGCRNGLLVKGPAESPQNPPPAATPPPTHPTTMLL